MKKIIVGIVLVLLILGLSGYAAYYAFFKDKGIHYFIIDINPSIELSLNENNEVVSVTPLNSDADVLLSDLNLVGLDIAEASDKIVAEATLAGYIDQYSEENLITVYSTNETETIREELQTRVMEKINLGLENKDVHALVVSGGLTDEMKTAADNYDISYGKYLLVSRLASLTTEYSTEDIVKMSVKNIQSEIKTIIDERRDSIAKDQEQLKTTLKTQKEAKIEECQNKIEQLKNQLLEQYQEQEKITLTAEEKIQKGKELLDKAKEQIGNYVSEIKENINKSKTSTSSQIDTNTINTIKNAIKNKNGK